MRVHRAADRPAQHLLGLAECLRIDDAFPKRHFDHQVGYVNVMAAPDA
ncbi:hypothetical protein ACPCUV_26635 [Streptomyces platensis]